MSFYIDKQTLDDLNIFGKKGRDSVFNLFNATRTRGGSQVLEEMFRYPMADAEAINQRTAVIRYMMENKMEFPFKGDLFDTLEYYLSNTDVRTQLTATDNTLQRKLKLAVGADNDFEQLQKGVMAAISILSLLQQFLEKMQRTDEANPYQEELQALRDLMQYEDLHPLLAERSVKTLSFEQTASLDMHTRFKIREHLLRILAYIYRLDVYISIASVAAKQGFCFAEALPATSNQLEAIGIWHPMVKNAVPNTLSTDSEGNVLFLTGANMAGKSTFMKTLGLTIFLAHTGFPVPAKQMRFAVLDGMYSTINLPDNLGNGYSHFYAEVMRVKKVAEHLGQSKRLLVIFDELFRGTNVKDAYDATVAITAAFAGRPDCLFLISTHIIEAGDELRGLCKNVRFIFMPTVMEGNIASYPYTLREGITTDRHGMMIINNENILDILHQPAGAGTVSSFITDKQTQDDLNLLGLFRPDSIFNIYNRTYTRGGKMLLEQLFRSPLNNAEAINERIAVFRFFQQQQIAWPVNAEVLDLSEQYLKSNGGGSTLSSFINMCRRKLMQTIGNDLEFGLLKEGQLATITLIREMKKFIEKLNQQELPSLLRPVIENVKKVCAEKQLAWVYDTKPASFLMIANRDHQLRSRFHEQTIQLLDAVYTIDMYLSVARLAQERNFCLPVAKPFDAANNHITIEGFYHPALTKAVPNSISVTNGKNVIFLTGANMAGKSTLMKSFSITVYLAHMGFPVPAASMDFSVQDGIYTSINVSDNLTLGHSHFYAEVIRVKKVAEEVSKGKNLVVVFDELFKGTNVKDAFDATVSVTEAFGDHRNCSYVISTHIIEVGQTLTATRNNLQFVYMPTVMKNGVPHYPYTMVEGITDDRHGMVIIQNENIISIIKNGTPHLTKT